jgi:nitrite reductase/ring-hydroxylating ferredoxin subunit
MQIERRKFLESACKVCLFTGAGLLISNLTACGPSLKIMNLPVTQDTIRLPLTAFATEPMQIVRPEGWFYNIAIRKSSSDLYEAMLMECSHQQTQLIAVSKGFECPLHGSKFNLNGQVTKGPAERPLKQFATGIEQDQLVIQLKSYINTSQNF